MLQTRSAGKQVTLIGTPPNILVTSALRNPGKKTAEIDDLIPRLSGKVQRPVLSSCAFLGLGEKVTAPFRRLQLKKDEFVYGITEQKLDQMADFDKDIACHIRYFAWADPMTMT
jgi:hypothetical protein